MSDRLALFDGLDGSSWHDGPETKAVHVDSVRGHIAVEVADDRPWIVFCDMGSVLKFFSYQGGDLTPTVAAELGAALTSWAEKRGAA